MGEDVQENPVEILNIGAALTTGVETGVALYVATIETEDVIAMIAEENTEVVTLEPSPKWGGTLIEEEHPEEQENVRTGDIPSTSATNLETPAP